jgi:hypothetical protein
MVLYRSKHNDEFSIATPHSGWEHDASLIPEAARMAPRIAALKAEFDAGKLPPVAFAAGYLVTYAQERNGSWLCGRRQRSIVLVEPAFPAPRLGRSTDAGVPDILGARVLDLPGWQLGDKATAKLLQHEARSGEAVTIARLFAEWQLQGIPLYAATSIAHWASRHRPLRLLFHVPSVQAVLRMQVRGERCVTAFVKPEQLSRRIEQRDAFDFGE